LTGGQYIDAEIEDEDDKKKTTVTQENGVPNRPMSERS